jgi:hypothetical protein
LGINLKSGRRHLSIAFLSAFHPDIAASGKQYRVMAAKVYRECSEFVHGNMHTHDLGATPLRYDKQLLDAWVSRAEAVRLCVIFAFAGRYLRLISKDGQGKVEGIMLDTFGHLSAVQAIYV